MLTDTHCHLNIVAKEKFDTLLNVNDYIIIADIINSAAQKNVTKIINVGTSLIESMNCVEIAKRFATNWATIGIHPNDLTDSWKNDLAQLKLYSDRKEDNKIVAIGECGMDFHYADHHVARQQDGFKAQIELALKYQLPLVVHTRAASQETLRILDNYIKDGITGVIHCFSEELDFAKQVISWGFVLGIGGTITYPKNESLRQVVKTVDLKDIILETDSPFLPIQARRGQKNSPAYIYDIAQYVAALKNCSLDQVALATNANVKKVFQI